MKRRRSPQFGQWPEADGDTARPRPVHHAPLPITNDRGELMGFTPRAAASSALDLCRRCRAMVYIDTDGRGNVLEYDADWSRHECRTPAGGNPATSTRKGIRMTVRAKFRVSMVGATDYGQTLVKAHPVYGGGPENNTYAKATPSGMLELTVDNPAVDGFFVPGREFYADFTAAE